MNLEMKELKDIDHKKKDTLHQGLGGPSTKVSRGKDHFDFFFTNLHILLLIYWYKFPFHIIYLETYKDNILIQRIIYNSTWYNIK